MWSFIKICLICIIGKNRLKEKFHRKTRNICTTHCHVAAVKIWAHFDLILKQQWTIEEISIFSNRSHLEWRAGLSDKILKGAHPKTIPARFGFTWFHGFRGKDLNVIFYQNMPNLPSKDHSSKVWSKLAQWFLRRRLKCEKFTTDDDRRRTKPDGKSSHGLWPGELIKLLIVLCQTNVNQEQHQSNNDVSFIWVNLHISITETEQVSVLIPHTRSIRNMKFDHVSNAKLDTNHT
jgi:hypothetical protein